MCVQSQLDEAQQRCRSLENAVTHGESEKRDLLEHLSKLVQAVEDRDAKLKEQVMVVLRCCAMLLCVGRGKGGTFVARA